MPAGANSMAARSNPLLNDPSLRLPGMPTTLILTDSPRSRSEEREGAHFYALAGRGVRGGCRILQRRVRCESCASVPFWIVNFENDRFVWTHLREINPTMVGVVFQPIGLSNPMRIAPLGHHPIVKRNAFGVGKCQRVGLDRPIDRAPHLNDCEAAFEQFVRLVGKYLP